MAVKAFMSAHATVASHFSDAASVKRPRADDRAAHLIEDVLVGAAIAAFAFDDRIPAKTVVTAVRILLEARSAGRAEELVEAAHQEAAAISNWQCENCDEVNPGTFQMCWNCSEPQSPDSEQLAAQSEVLLEIDSMATLRNVREPEERASQDTNNSLT